MIENFAQAVGNRSDVWYATNIEVYDYVQAYNRLEFSADCRRVYNPTALEIWFVQDDVGYSVKPGRCITCGC